MASIDPGWRVAHPRGPRESTRLYLPFQEYLVTEKEREANTSPTAGCDPGPPPPPGGEPGGEPGILAKTVNKEFRNCQTVFSSQILEKINSVLSLLPLF